MAKILSFLQRLYKNIKRYSESLIRYVISKVKVLGEKSRTIIDDLFTKYKEVKQHDLKNRKRNFTVTKIGCTCKQLLACILNYKVVIKCKKGVLHFVRKINPVAWLRMGRTTMCSGLVLLVSIVLLFVMTEGENLEFAFAADSDIVNPSKEGKYIEEELIDASSLVVDEKTEQSLQNINEEKFLEVVLPENQEEKILCAETASYKAYATAVTESILENTDIGEKLDCQKAKFKDKEISVMTVNDYNLQVNYGMTEGDLELLERIIEAEAGGEDLKGKVLVANVVLNRVKSSQFPNTVEGVILQRDGGGAQFSPVSNGSLWTVSVSQETKDAASRALNGEDYSEGALYFMARKYSTSSNIAWFDSSLTKLFKHGCHEFFK